MKDKDSYAVIGATIFLMSLFAGILRAQPEQLVINGSFDMQTEWSLSGDCIITNSQALFGSGGTERGRLSQILSTRSEYWYCVRFDKLHEGINYNSGVMAAAYNASAAELTNCISSHSVYGKDMTNQCFYFKAKGDQTVIQFSDFNVYGAGSHDAAVDNISATEITTPVRADINITSYASVTQSTFLSSTEYPQSALSDGAPDNSARTYTNAPAEISLMFDFPVDISSIALIPLRDDGSYPNNAGDMIEFFDSSNEKIWSAPIADYQYQLTFNSGTNSWSNVQSIRITETNSTPLIIAELEVYSTHLLRSAIPSVIIMK